MHFLISRKSLYSVLRKIVGVITLRPKLNILSHILLALDSNYLVITATDLEIEIVVKVLLNRILSTGSITTPGRKFFEICRSFSESSEISIASKNNKLIVCSGTSNFSVSTLPSSDFPKLDKQDDDTQLVLSQSILKKMIELTHFSMGNQDTRYYLNGIFFETTEHMFRLVATDGYRLAMCEICIETLLPLQKIIVPRKGIIEMLRLLEIDDNRVSIRWSRTNIHMNISNYILTSKLIDAKFPNYRSIFSNISKNILEASCIDLRNALKRVAIISNDKVRVVRFYLKVNRLKVTSNNFNCETSEETLNVIYNGEDMNISFNVDYILDILNVIGDQNVRFSLINDISSVQIESESKDYGAIYIVMPIRM